ncbi:MAG: hypothetical protein E7454_02910 [Ruminococcaceae bacterium]|nr:hypothetical protein [Oscillospiraceae bacterium]
MLEKNNRSINSLLNAISAISLTLVNGLMGFVVTRLILSYYGSDFNGLNSTANQVVHVLMIIEGGFITASNVAVFAPYGKNDYQTVNGILSATRKKFHKIGLLFFLVGTAVSVGYALLANSSMEREFIATVIMMTMIPPAFNLFAASTYRVLLQAQQKEYIVSFTTTVTIGLGHLCNIIMITNGGPMWMVRVNTMTFSLLSYLIIIAYTRKKNRFIDLKEPPRPELIKGTNDVMAQRITSVIYDSAPMIFLSVSSSGGTVMASVYAVYNNVFIILKSLLRSVIDAPRLSFGQMLTQRKREDVWPAFAQYEFLIFTAIFVLLTTTCALILPFVGLYTADVNDANYYDKGIAIMMVIVAVLELMHIPSNHLINMAGEFRISRNIQIVSCGVLLAGLAVGGSLWGMYGMLGALIVVDLLLAVLEMGYVHIRFFKKKLLSLLKLVLPLAVAGVAVCWAEMSLPLPIHSYFAFAVYGVILVVVNGVIGVAVGLLFNRKELLALLKRAKNLIKRK